ncbi:MAG: type IV pilus modification protein PilV [Comamonadaceae bacterium]|nr:type IV pilus modification protein PilV [Comamonadaceae bacterium]
MHHRLNPPQHSQRGITLIESLVAIVVAALGILGIVGVQLRTLTDTQTSVRRAQAIRLIEDLSERMKVNPNALNNLANYQIGWSTATGTPALTPRAANLCDTATACSNASLAQYDIREWKRAVEGTLPLGDANVFAAPGDPTRQLGVMISWRENERADASGDTAYSAAINTVTSGGGSGAGVTCPANRTCHLQYLPVAARCAPYNNGSGTPQYYCPGS